jgi:putative flippase GtrA
LARAFVSGEFARFLLTGGVAAGVNVVSRWALSHAMVYEAAVAVAYLFGMATAYGLSRAFVFERSGRTMANEAVRFAIVNVAALAQVWVVSVGLARLVFPAVGFTWHAEDVAHLIGVVVPAVTSYFGHRHFSFSARREGGV